MKLKSEYKELLDMAKEALESAYAPYSKSKVGAAIRTKEGGIFAGCNVENSSFSVTTCAEGNAIAAAVLYEGPQMEIDSIAVISKNVYGEETAITPCGACRQAIVEFSKCANVIFIEENGEVKVELIGNLLPHSYSSKTFKDN